MTRKTKLFTTLAFSGILAFTGAVVGTKANNIFGSHAETCSHEHVEHYLGYNDDETGKGYVEHWACCECHTAWADAQRTTVIGNTSTERDDIDLDYGFKVNWGARNMAPTFGGTGVTVFTDNNFGIDAVSKVEDKEGKLVDTDPYYFVEKIGGRVLENNEFVELTIINNSTADLLNVQILNKDWGPIGIDTKQCTNGVGQVIKFSFEQWNSNPIFIVKEPSKVFTSGSLTFEVSFGTKPFIDETDALLYEGCAINSSLNGWASFGETGNDKVYGTYKILKIADAPAGGNFDVIVNGTGGLEKGKYSDVKFAIYNPNHFDIGLTSYMSNSTWGSLDYQDCGTLIPGWNEVHLDPTKLEDSMTHFITLRLDFSNGGNSDEWLISKFAGVLRTGDVIYADRLINSDLTNWDSFMETGVDAIYGNYKILNLSKFSGEIQIIVNGVSPISPAKYDKVTFAIYNPTESDAILTTVLGMEGWDTVVSAFENTALHPGWNELTFSSSFFSHVNVTNINIKINLGSSTLDGWKISQFFARHSRLALTDYHFGQVTKTGIDDPVYGNVYNLIQEQWFIDNPNENNNKTMASFQKGVLATKLPKGKEALVFKIYNPSNQDIDSYIGGGEPYYTSKHFLFKSKEWTEVVITAEDIIKNNDFTLYYYILLSNASGWQVTDIWAI